MNYVSIRLIKKYLRIDKHDVILDFGCGIGRVSRLLSDMCAEIDAVDITPGMIESATKTYDVPKNVNYKLLLDTTVPYEDQRFDKIFTFWVLGHCNEVDINAYLNEMHRMLKANGTVVLFEQTRRTEFIYDSWSIQRTIDQYKMIAKDAGFDVSLTKHVIRNPSHGMTIWRKFNKTITALLPILYYIDRSTMTRREEHVEYYTTVFVLKKTTSL